MTEDHSLNIFCKNIRILRITNRLTQKDIAKNLGSASIACEASNPVLYQRDWAAMCFLMPQKVLEYPSAASSYHSQEWKVSTEFVFRAVWVRKMIGLMADAMLRIAGNGLPRRALPSSQ